MRRLKDSAAFNFSRSGTFGVFRPDSTKTQLFYVQTSFGAPEIETGSLLKSAREALTDQELNFDVLIQREIYEGHVTEIAAYLEQTDTVRFLPPLVAALVKVEGNQIVNYPPLKVEAMSDDGPVLSLTWGNLATVKIAIAEADYTGDTVRVEPVEGKESYEVIPNLSVLKLTQGSCKLVVVDGQHRLRALQRILKTGPGREKLKNLTIPVVIFFPPWATTDEKKRTVLDTLRKVFVDINQGAKRVSGHFTTLLNDFALDALAVRAFCEAMRVSGNLWLVEWSEHEERRSNQLNLWHSVTGVGVLRKAIAESGLKAKHMRAIFPALLGLESIRAQLEAEGSSTEFAQLVRWDAPFSTEDRGLITNQIRTVFVPVLTAIFLDLKPYVFIRKTVMKVIDKWKGEGGANRLDAVNRFLDATKPAEPVPDHQKLVDEIASAVQDVDQLNLRLYRTQRFQQGLFAFFYGVIFWALEFQSSLSPKEMIDAAIKHLNATAFSEGTKLFDKSSGWLRGTILQSDEGDIIARNSTRDRVFELLSATLGSKAKAKALARMLAPAEGDEALSTQLWKWGELHSSEFWSNYLKARISQFRDTIDAVSLDEEVRTRLQALLAAERSAPDTAKRIEAERTFEAEVLKHLEPQLSTLRSKLQKALDHKIVEGSAAGQSPPLVEDE